MNKRPLFVVEKFLFIYNVLAIIFVLFLVSNSPLKWILVCAHFVLIVYFIFLINLPLSNLFRIFFPALIVIVYFNELHFLIPHTKFYDMDQFLILADYWLFGSIHPVIWISSYSNPLVNDIMQLVYSTFYILPLSLVIYLAFQKDRMMIINSLRVLIMGFLLSYIMYFFVSALGPRFYQENLFSNQLDGSALFWSIHNWINDMEKINWDAFPSGHTAIAVLSAMLASTYRLRIKLIYWILTIGIIFSTVYLRYHYVVDVIAGIIFALIVWRLNEKWHLSDLKIWIRFNENNS